MRDEYEEPTGGMNPLKIGIVGAVVIAVILAVVLQFRSYTETKAARERDQASFQAELAKIKKQNRDLESQLDELRHKSEDSESRLQKSLKLRESQIVSAGRQRESENRSAEAKIAALNKQKDELEDQIGNLKKDADARAQDLKKTQDQLAKLQSDLKTTRSDADRYARDAKVLQAKLNNINQGDVAAADLMVQQLAETRQQLKREQAAKQALQEEIESLRQSQAKPQ
jgi:chromosome segregation ATPase